MGWALGVAAQAWGVRARSLDKEVLDKRAEQGALT